MLKSNLVKALTFYEKTEEKLRQRLQSLTVVGAFGRIESLSREGAAKERKDLEQEVRDLRKYAYYNREAIRKIAKKYDKRCGKSKTMQAELMEKLHGSPMAHAEQRCEVLLKSLQEDSPVTVS